MARASKLTPGKIETIRKARASGATLRQAAELAGVSHVTVRSIESRTAAVGHSSKASTGGKKTKPVPDPVAAPPAAKRGKKKEPPPAAAEAEVLLAQPQIDPAAPGALDLARRRHTLIHTLLEALEPGVRSGAYPAAQYVTVAKYADDLTMLISQLTPPAPKDPNDDPDALEAERVLLSRLESMIADAEKRAAADTGGEE